MVFIPLRGFVITSYVIMHQTDPISRFCGLHMIITVSTFKIDRNLALFSISTSSVQSSCTLNNAGLFEPEFG